MNPLYLEAISLRAPGLAGWEESQAVLLGEQPYRAEAMPKSTVILLPANERRRTTATIKLALQVAQEALAQTHVDAQMVCTVLASSGGDSSVVHAICTALLQPDRPVSPTQFHHSVHNTPAGYWSIATGCKLPSTSLSAYDGSFVAGLREASTLALAEMKPVLLIAYDLPLPFPLSAQRRIIAPFAVALLLNPVATKQRLALLRLHLDTTGSACTLNDMALEQLRIGNPAARCLPLLQGIAQQTAQSVRLDAGHGTVLSVEIEM